MVLDAVVIVDVVVVVDAADVELFASRWVDCG